jgi:hypothetical protein
MAVGRLIRALLFSAALLVAMAHTAFAQDASPAASEGPDVFGNFPGAVFLLVPIVIGGALYVSRRLGPQDDEAAAPRREGAVSRALAGRRKP